MKKATTPAKPKTATKVPSKKPTAPAKPKVKVSKNEAEIYDKLALIVKKSGMTADDLSKKTKLAKVQLPKETPGSTSPSFRNMITVVNALGYEISLKKIKVEK